MSQRSVAILGAGLGGLSAAIHARLRGYDVTVYEKSDRAGGKATQLQIDGYSCDIGPSIVILNWIYDELFAAAGRNASDYLTFDRIPTVTRIFVEGAEPFDLKVDDDEGFERLRKESPRDAQALADLLQRLDGVASGIEKLIFKRPVRTQLDFFKLDFARFAMAGGGMKPFKSAVDQLFETDIMRGLFYGFPSYNGVSYMIPNPGAFLIPYYMLRHGVSWPRGGIGSIPKAVLALALELGVSVVYSKAASGLVQHSDGSLEVRFEDGDSQAYDAVISNVDRLTVEGWQRRTIEATPSLSYLAVNVGVARKVARLEHHNVFLPRKYGEFYDALYRRREFSDDPVFYVHAPSVSDPTVAPIGCENLFYVQSTPACEGGIDWQAVLDRALSLVASRLNRYGLGVSESDCTVLHAQTPLEFAKNHGNWSGGLFGPGEKGRLWGFMPLRCRDEKIPNLYYCGASVQPGAGMPMVILSGKFAASYLPKI